MAAIELRGLTRHYGEVRAVHDVSFELSGVWQEPGAVIREVGSYQRGVCRG